MVKKSQDKPAPPKKALSPFFRYRSEVFNQVKAEHPECKVTQLTSIIAEMWNKIDDQTKKRIEEQYIDNKAKIDKEREEYEKVYGKIERKKKVKKNKKKKTQQADDDE